MIVPADPIGSPDVPQPARLAENARGLPKWHTNIL